MSLRIQRSRFESDLFEVIEDDVVIEEMSIPFLVRKIPPSFASKEALLRWRLDIEFKLAKVSAYRSLARKSRSSEELRRKLIGKKYAPSVCDQVIGEMQRLGYLSDAEYFDRAIERAFEKGYGPRYIAMKLQLSLEEVKRAISDERQREKIAVLWPKEVRKGEEKAIRALSRKGFDLSLIRLQIFFSTR